MRATWWAVVVSLVVSAAVGVVLGLTFILIGQAAGEAGGESGGGASVLRFVGAAILLSWPTSMPLGVLGGVLTAIVLARQRLPTSFVIWVIRGIGVGGVLGALGGPATPLFYWGAAGSRGVDTMAAMYSLVGAAGGVLTGALVALWCYWVQQHSTRHTGGRSGA